MIQGKKVVAVIPARYASTRYPGKPLVDLGGKPMIQRTYEQVATVKGWDQIIIATDDERIFKVAKSFGATAMMTSMSHVSGTDRCAEVLANLGDGIDYIVNIQGDEPYIEPQQLIEITNAMDSNAPILTLVKQITTIDTLFNPNCPKVVLDNKNQALYFSRHAIPYMRGLPQEDWLTHHRYFKHIGLYAYRSDILLSISKLPASDLETSEALEQLRWLQNGFPIQAVETQYETMGIDSPEDLEKIKKLGFL
jgi:3-deoxy-manno-octulosonate cytidylyltransferase (CMP-KDO synthetase)